MCPDNRQHRGAHPADGRLFAEDQLPLMRAATSELSWLLSRRYASKSALKLVGDRHNLTERQRLAVSRAACSDAQKEKRRATCLPARNIKGESLIVDGFNLIITVEAALGGGLLIRCRDGCVRDLSSVHGSYRSVRETEKAVSLVGEAFEALTAGSVKWLFDRPVSNSGRLAQKVGELAAERHWPWAVEVIYNPDAEIIRSDAVAVTSDSTILDGAGKWVNLNEYLIRQYLPESWLVDLNESPG